MNEVRITGTLDSVPESWFVDEVPFVRCHVRSVLPAVGGPLATLGLTAVLEVFARGDAAVAVWKSWPGARLSLSGQLSFLAPGVCAMPEPSGVVVEAESLGMYQYPKSPSDQCQLVLSGIVDDAFPARRRPSERLEAFWLRPLLATPTSSFGPHHHSIATWLDPKLAKRTGGFDLGQQVTLLGHLATPDEELAPSGTTRAQFLATHLLEGSNAAESSLILPSASEATGRRQEAVIH